MEIPVSGLHHAVCGVDTHYKMQLVVMLLVLGLNHKNNGLSSIKAGQSLQKPCLMTWSSNSANSSKVSDVSVTASFFFSVSLNQ